MSELFTRIESYPHVNTNAAGENSFVYDLDVVSAVQSPNTQGISTVDDGREVIFSDGIAAYSARPASDIDRFDFSKVKRGGRGMYVDNRTHGIDRSAEIAAELMEAQTDTKLTIIGGEGLVRVTTALIDGYGYSGREVARAIRGTVLGARYFELHPNAKKVPLTETTEASEAAA